LVDAMMREGMILTGRIYGRQKERKKCKRRKIKKK